MMFKSKISIHRSDDSGYFKNSYDDSNHGQFKQNTIDLPLFMSQVINSI